MNDSLEQIHISTYAPIIIPTLCRYEHFKQCIESLAKCTWADKTEVYIGLDYPAKEAHWDGYKKISDYIDSIKGFKEVHVFKRISNLGISKNIVDLRKQVQRSYDRWIFSEDDNVFSPNFLVYMNKCLECYKDDPKISAICGYTMPVNWRIDENNHFATRYFRAWGYGNWSNKFDEYKACCNGNWLCDFLFKKKNVNHESFFQLFKNDYGIWWAAIKHLYLKRIHYGDMMRYTYLLGMNQYIICPSVSMVKNIGFDSSAQNYKCAPEWLTDAPIDNKESFELTGNPYSFVEENELRRRVFEKKINNRLSLRNIKYRVMFIKIVLKVLLRGKKNRNW